MHVNLVNSWLYVLTVTTRVISSGDLYRCLLPQCEALRTCRSGFPITTWCCDQDVKVVPGADFTKKRAIGAVRCKKEKMLLQPLRLRWVECVIQHERDVREEQAIIEWLWRVISDDTGMWMIEGNE